MFNRVLIRRLPMRSFTAKENIRGYCVDGSALPFVVEELVACSANQICVAQDGVLAEFVEDLDPVLRSHIEMFDPLPSIQKSRAFLEPIKDEFKVVTYGTDGRAGASVHHNDRNITGDVVETIFGLDELIVGSDNHLQIEFDHRSVSESVHRLRVRSSSPEARARLALIEGTLACYEPVESSCLCFRSLDREPFVEHFLRLVEDAGYQELCESAHEMGFPGRMKRSLEVVRRKVTDLLQKPKIAELFDLGSKGLTAATKVPIPNSKATAAIFSSGYLPPLVALDASVRRAFELWRRQKPKPIPPSITNEGFGEIEFE